jgi:hypothetical protein
VADPAEAIEAASAASPYLKLFGQVAGGVMMARSAALALTRLGEAGTDHAFFAAKLVTARFYAEQLLPPALALAENLGQMSKTVMALDVETL